MYVASRGMAPQSGQAIPSPGVANLSTETDRAQFGTEISPAAATACAARHASRSRPAAYLCSRLAISI